MQKDDARKLDHATLEALRIRAVRSVQDGESPKDVARTLRVTARAMYRRVPATARVIRIAERSIFLPRKPRLP
jgi:hypothetical protein